MLVCRDNEINYISIIHCQMQINYNYDEKVVILVNQSWCVTLGVT